MPNIPGVGKITYADELYPNNSRKLSCSHYDPPGAAIIEGSGVEIVENGYHMSKDNRKVKYTSSPADFPPGPHGKGLFPIKRRGK